MAEPPGETGGTEASENGGGRGWGGQRRQAGSLEGSLEEYF